MDEKQTRKDRIDLLLGASGWDVSDRTQVRQEFHIHPSAGDEEGKVHAVHEEPAEYGASRFSDYVLLSKSGNPLAVVEAKKSSLDAARVTVSLNTFC
jgi:type I restriction enzyme, R subunit